MTRDAEADPRGLIAEAYRVPLIGESECRTIFLDWVLGLPKDADVAGLARTLLERLEADPQHPMTAILRSASDEAGTTPGRRGRRRPVSGGGRPPPTRGS